ncbi:MAG TPA: response regulator transcription factor [Candidatus Limnocylindrales bacterium]|nr:response regulator transcription factor [Candidatus Limnocylindrales bacterium]
MASSLPHGAAAPPRLLVVDDHEVVRTGLVSVLERHGQFQVVAQAATRAEALAQAQRFVPDVVLMDMRLPDGSGIEAAHDIREVLPGTRIVFLTSSADDEDVLAAILGGASGYALKETRASALIAMLQAVARGESQLDPKVTGLVMDRIRRLATGELHDETEVLTTQERRILLLLAEGKTNREIAAIVFLSDKTVKNYASAIFRKLHLERRSQTAAFVAKSGRMSPWNTRSLEGS